MNHSQQTDPSVVVSEPAVGKLAAYLKEVGRLQGGPNDVRAQLNVAVKRTWATAKSVAFKDVAGPGWMLDLSDTMDGMMLYAIVRSQMGTRQVVAVVDVDEVERFHATNTWETQEAFGEIDPNKAAEMAKAHSQDQASNNVPADVASAFQQLAAQPKTSPDDPCMIIYWQNAYVSEHEDGDYLHDVIIRCKRSEVPENISRLLQEGIEQKHIEVWTGMSQPKVQVIF